MFKRINVETWARKEYFEHYRQVPCSYSMTVKLDITKLRERIHRHFPCFGLNFRRIGRHFCLLMKQIKIITVNNRDFA